MAYKLNQKIKIFAQEISGGKVEESLQKLFSNDNVLNISCLPDFYQKEHTKWPSGITVVAKDTILPNLLEGVGCGISLFKLKTDDSFEKEKLKEIMELIAKSIKDIDIIRKSAELFKQPESIIQFQDYLILSEIGHIGEKWRNDTLSEIRFNQLDEKIFNEYVDWPPRDMGLALIEGNHFIEIQEVEEIFNQKFSEILQIDKGDILLMIHLESEGLNLELEKKFNKKYSDKKITYPSKEANEYISLTNISQRYCLMNRIIIARAIIESLKKKNFGIEELSFVFDVTHCGIFKRKENGKIKLYHHTGASPALPPGDVNLSKIIRSSGQPLILPGALGTESYILKSSEGTTNSSFTINHGLGRKISKAYARANFKEEDVPKTFKYKDMQVKQVSGGDLASQMNTCYKDISKILEIITKNNLATKVAKVKPLGIIKG
ncbi:RtcB family protein [Candidatus Woesearchaeota archaeon]|nr:RtcB family protein [Candidatus Woesearchaeota archaeon]